MFQLCNALAHDQLTNGHSQRGDDHNSAKMAGFVAEEVGQFKDAALDYATYEDYLDSHVKEEDLFYLEVCFMILFASSDGDAHRTLGSACKAILY